MPSLPAGPLAVDLDVLKLADGGEPVDFDDVERALYALTGWQKPQHLVDAMLDVIQAYARGIRAGRVAPRRAGHLVVACTRPHLGDGAPTHVAVACQRAHLDEHTCPVTVKTVRVEAPLDAQPPTVEPEPMPSSPRSHSGVARVPAMTVEELLADGLDESQLRPAQRAARAVLLAGEQRCTDCGVTKPLDSFYRDKAKLTGRMGKCADCSNAAAARRRGKTPQ